MDFIKNNKKLIIISIASLVALITIGSIYYLSHGFKNWPIKEENSSSIESSTQSNGIELHLLSTTNNDDGSIIKTFSFSITPSNATDQTVSVSAKYKDGTSCQNCLTVEANNYSKRITLHCLKAFSKQIIIEVVSNSNPNINATVTVDYVKKISSIQSPFNDKYVCIGNGWSGSENIQINDFSFSSMINTIYSSYTKNSDYTFSVKDVDVSFEDVGGELLEYKEYNLQEIFTDYHNGYAGYGVKTLFSDLLEERIKTAGEIPSADDIWNIPEAAISSNIQEVRNCLYDISTLDPSSFYLTFLFSATYYCNENTSISFTYKSESLNVSFKNDYTDKFVPVKNLLLENYNIEF